MSSMTGGRIRPNGLSRSAATITSARLWVVNWPESARSAREAAVGVIRDAEAPFIAADGEPTLITSRRLLDAY
jgi:hypothetical protein